MTQETGPSGAPVGTDEEPAVGTAAPTSPADAAMTRYRASMRRSRRIYYAILAVVVAGLGSWVAVAWSSGEVAHTSLHVVAPAPPTLGIQAPSQSPQEAWHTSDRIAIGEPQWGGTVVTYAQHTVGGRDARTGRRTWSYTRSDRTVCTAAQLAGTTIAVYAVHGNCDEVSAFDSGTGRRRWTRTLDIDGMPLNGRPSYQFTSYTLLIASPSVIYAIDPVTGLDRWTYYRFGCRIGHVALGGSGALISQTCSHLVHCKGLKFCARGPQLLLRDGSAGQQDNKPNGDQIKWNDVGNTDIPVSADDVVSAVDPGGSTLHLLDAGTGKQKGTVPLTPASARLGPITATQTDSGDVIWISGQMYAVQSSSSSLLWSTDTPSPPVIVSTTGQSPPPLATARITVPTSSGVGIVDGNNGNVIERFTLQPPAAGSVVYSLGTGFMVAGGAGIIAYR